MNRSPGSTPAGPSARSILSIRSIRSIRSTRDAPILRAVGLAVALASCRGGEVVLDEPSLPKGVGLLIVEPDFTGGSTYVESIAPDSHAVTTKYGLAYDADPHLRALVDPRTGKKRYFLVGSRFEKLTEITRGGSVIAAYPVGDEGDEAGSADPLDVAIAPDGAMWVTRWLRPTLVVLEPSGVRRRIVDLSAFTPADAAPTRRAPSMNAIARVGRTMYVALSRLARGLDPTNVSQVVAIDAETYAVGRVLDLPARNPWNYFKASPGAPNDLWIGCLAGPKSRPVIHGAALLRIDVASWTAKIALSEEEAGGFVAGFHVVNERTAFASVAAFEGQNPTTLIRFDPSTGKKQQTIYGTSHYYLWDVVGTGSTLFVANRDERGPGVDSFSILDGAHLGRLRTKGAPSEIVILADP